MAIGRKPTMHPWSKTSSTRFTETIRSRTSHREGETAYRVDRFDAISVW